MKYLIKTNDYASLGDADCQRVVYDAANDKVYVQTPTPTFDYVDLGLPSGLKWATCNVGASTPEEAGLYFAWGETQGYTAAQVGTDKQFDWLDYKYGTSSSNYTKYNTTDGLTTLEAADDAVVANMGGKWRMPTQSEIAELWQNTDPVLVAEDDSEISGTWSGSSINWSDTSHSNNQGVRFYKKGDHSVSMFVPSAGYAGSVSVRNVGQSGGLWSSSVYSELNYGWYLYFRQNYGRVDYDYRDSGHPVRGVLAQ